MRIIWTEAFNRTVFFISHIIECRNIDSFDLCCHLQKFFPRSATLLILFIGIQKLIIDRLAFSHIEQVEELR